ncbi:MAG: TMAO reductase system periplasmic protein TorT [Candidatus Pseudothioglobus sp.]|tara:strand:+ start:2307 stop:3497 length:1191 start_codon:yes stop_codon:yes gene_type:complete
MFLKRIQNRLKIVILSFLFILNAPNFVYAYDGSYWTQNVNVFNLSCTDGDVACWIDERNALDTLPLIMYKPLKASEVKKKHHICVSFPHLKDSYWVGVAYGIISEGRRLEQKITLFEAGGYTNLATQLNQVDDCLNNEGDALIIGPISSNGNAKQIELIREKGIPVVIIITGINTEVDANSLQSFVNMGYTSCKWVADQEKLNKEKTNIVWFPGPPGAGWSIASHEGCLSALEGTNIRILETNWGDTGKAIQLKLVEETLLNHASGPEPNFKYIVGTGTTIEAAVGALRARKLGKKINLVSTYYTPGIDMFIKRGLISMAPSDQMISQAIIAVDQAVRLLEGKQMATLGRPEFNNTGRITEHVQQQILIVTPDTYDKFDSSTTLAPKGWSPKFSVD